MTMALTMSGSALAQDQKSAADEVLAEVNPEQVGEQAAKLLTQLETIIGESRVYSERLVVASSEDSLVLQLQIDARQDRFMETLQQIAEITNQEDETGDNAQLLDRTRIVFSDVTPQIWELISETRTKIDRLRSQRQGTAAADISVLEDNLRRLTIRLDRFFEFGLVHIQELESLGLDAGADRIIFNDLLASRADELSGRIELALLRITELKARLQETPDNTDLNALWQANSKNLESNATSQAVILDLMDVCELPTQEYRIQLVSTTQNLAGGLRDFRVASTIFKRSWAGISTWLVEKGPTLLFKLVIFLVIIVAGRFLAGLVRKAVEKSFNKANVNLSQLLRRMIVNAAHNTVLGLALLIALSQLGFSLGPLLAGFGVVGFILGFAMQDSLSNLAAGMMILVNRPYDVGDMVEISGVFGKVEQMSMVSTSILTVDNQKLIVPNSRIWGDVIKNVTDQKVRRVDMVFGISYSDDIPQAERVLNEILASSELVLDDPAPVVRVHALGESSVDFVVRPWVKTPDYWDTHWAITKAVKMRFDAEGISIPFPQRDVHVFETQPVTKSQPELEGSAPKATVTNDPDEIAGNEG
jgi:small conductance mechanosensitive channel